MAAAVVGVVVVDLALVLVMPAARMASAVGVTAVHRLLQLAMLLLLVAMATAAAAVAGTTTVPTRAALMDRLMRGEALIGRECVHDA